MSIAFEIVGRLTVIEDTEIAKGKHFKSRSCGILSRGEYFWVEFHQDDVNLLDDFKLFDNVNISILLKGRHWEGPTGKVKHFNTLVAWKIKKA